MASNEKQKKNIKNSAPVLENWEKWMQERERVYATTAKKTHRRLDKLLMNASEDLRNVVEDKLVLDYAKVNSNFDKYRGNPADWKLPPTLYDPCTRDHRSEYEKVMTKTERNIIPTIEYVGVPEVIQAEKHIVPRTRNLYFSWQNSAYRQEKIKQLSKKICSIEPHRPEYSNLVVLGTSLMPSTKPETPNTTDISSPKTSEESQVELAICLPKKDETRLQLEVNGIILNKSTCITQNDRNLRFIFDYDLSLQNFISKSFILSNTGRVTLRVYLQKVKQFRLFDKYVANRAESFQFYCYINEILLVPLQSQEIFVYHRAYQQGVYTETWELTTKPMVWDKGFHFYMHFTSYAYWLKLQDKVLKTISTIEMKLQTNLVKEILDYIKDSIDHPITSVLECEYDEQDLFEAANLIDGVPQYIYDKMIVHELKNVYDSIKLQGDIALNGWNYSIELLKNLAQNQDIIDYRKKNEFRLPKILKPPSDEEVVKKRKGKKETTSAKDKKSEKSIKSTVTKVSTVTDDKFFIPIERAEYLYSNRNNLQDIVSKLEKPIRRNLNREKAFHCAVIFSSYIDQMLQKLEELEECLGITILTINNIKSTQQIPDRLIYEYYDDFNIKKITLLDSAKCIAKPKSKLIRHLPPDDIENIYLTYFNKPPSALHRNATLQTKANKGKGKGKVKEKDKGKVKEKDKGKEKVKKNVIPEVSSVQEFDPFAETFDHIHPVTESHSDNRSTTSYFEDIPNDKVKDIYDNFKYIIVYSCLGEAVQAIVDEIESLKCNVPYKTLNHIKKIYDT